jgi:Ca2+/Na+ antiporter
MDSTWSIRVVMVVLLVLLFVFVSFVPGVDSFLLPVGVVPISVDLAIVAAAVAYVWWTGRWYRHQIQRARQTPQTASYEKERRSVWLVRVVILALILLLGIVMNFVPGVYSFLSPLGAVPEWFALAVVVATVVSTWWTGRWYRRQIQLARQTPQSTYEKET